MEVTIVSQKLIQPSTPTPQNLTRYEISYFDDLNPPMNVGLILYYPSKPQEIRQLEESLAKILPQFYPLAGRYIKKDHLVDCSDQGAEFVRAEAVDVKLSEVVGKSSTSEELRSLLPHQLHRLDDAVTTPLLSVQITGFKCGGLAMGISISHRVFDMHSVGTFITAWRNAYNPAAGGGEITPSFEGPSLFPWKVNPGHTTTLTETFPEYDLKRFVFNKQAIASLRSKLKSSGTAVISRVRVVTAVISKALMGLDRAKSGMSRAHLFMQVINIRGRTIPALPEHSCGNLTVMSCTPRIPAANHENIGIQELVDVIGEATEKTIRYFSEILQVPGADRGRMIDDYNADFAAKSQEGGEVVNSFLFTDCSKFGFSEADFGWGKPVWHRIGALPFEDTIVLMENKEDDGIEAWLHLNENDMSYFEQDEDISFFAT